MNAKGGLGGYRFLALALLLACASPSVLAAESAIELSPCELRLPGTPLTGAAECGWFEVAENPAEPDGRRIRLRVARVPAQGRKAEPDPLVFLAGGPGQAATEAWLIVASALRRVNESRDIVLIDQRGTGQSNPLSCPQVEIDEALGLEWEDLAQSTRACLDKVEGDPRFYTTSIAVQDLDLVREALRYEQVNLLGVSYGTRVAQVYLRNYPERVRSMVLDSVVPQDLILGTEHASKLEQAIDRVLAACAADSECNQRFPAGRQQLSEMAEALRQEPVNVSTDHPLTGERLEFEFDRDALASAVRFLTYSAETQAMLPLLIHEAASNNDFSRLASQLLITAAGFGDSISQGMELSVICSEDYPSFPEEDPASEPLLMGDVMLRTTDIQCGIWPRGEAPADFHTPVQSEVPALLLSGEFDPVTPPEYAESVLQHLPNGVHLVAAGQGHSVTPKGCLGRVVSDFIAAGSSAELDTECVAQLQISPFFVSLTGPQP